MIYFQWINGTLFPTDGYFYVGQGYCRTREGQAERPPTVKGVNLGTCLDKCIENNCTGIEYIASKQHCELHEKNLAFVKYGKGSVCYARGMY